MEALIIPLPTRDAITLQLRSSLARIRFIAHCHTTIWRPASSKPEGSAVIPWFKQANAAPGQSVCRHRWITNSKRRSHLSFGKKRLAEKRLGSSGCRLTSVSKIRICSHAQNDISGLTVDTLAVAANCPFLLRRHWETGYQPILDKCVFGPTS